MHIKTATDRVSYVVVHLRCMTHCCERCLVTMSNTASTTQAVRTEIPARLDHLHWSRWHWLVVISLAITGWLFVQGALNAQTLTICWSILIFFSSAGACSSY